MAPRRDRPRQHARCVHRPPAPQAALSSGGAGDRDGARHGLPLAMMRVGVSLRRRLLMSVVGALALVLLIGAFNIVLRDRLGHEADSALAARASAELASLGVVGGMLVAAEAPDAAAPDVQAWAFGAGQRVLEQPRTNRAVQRAAE